ncbi:MAG: FprA family A-type flavoprotein [Planctomycetota bacterium]
MHTEVCPGIDWVGYVDWNVRDFHSYDTHRGATYNSYLVRDEKTALIDAVKGPYGGQLLRNIRELCDPAAIDYVVCNHAEPDHAGALPEVLEAMPRATLLCDKKCAAALARYFDTSNWNLQLVGTGSSVTLGRRTLRFYETPMVHWPESMFTYVPEERVLFSMDAFGQHYATSQRFDDECDLGQVMAEARSYYANIVMPYGKSVAACLENAGQLDIRMIVPSHGVIWRKHPEKILAAYRDWCVHKPKAKVLVVYDSMWESTTAMADAILEGAIERGAEAQLIHVRRTNLTRIATEVLDAACLALGSATLNRDMMPAMAAALCYLKGLRPMNKTALSFGSYGWGRGGAEAIHEWIGAMGWDVLQEPIRANYRPTGETLELCRSAGRALAAMAFERAAAPSATQPSAESVAS